MMCHTYYYLLFLKISGIIKIENLCFEIVFDCFFLPSQRYSLDHKSLLFSFLDLRLSIMVAFYILLTFISIAHAFPKSSRPTPTHYFIFGDKFSGVIYLSKILNNTTPALPLQECRGIDLKSGSIHFDQEKETSWRYGFFSFNDLKKNLDCDIDKTLFILSVRDVRSMMCSVAKRKFQTSVEKLQSMHINGLIIHRWEDNDNLELNGSANANYKVYNYLRMRTHKLQTHYSILSRVPYGTIVR